MSIDKVEVHLLNCRWLSHLLGLQSSGFSYFMAGIKMCDSHCKCHSPWETNRKTVMHCRTQTQRCEFRLNPPMCPSMYPILWTWTTKGYSSDRELGWLLKRGKLSTNFRSSEPRSVWWHCADQRFLVDGFLTAQGYSVACIALPSLLLESLLKYFALLNYKHLGMTAAPMETWKSIQQRFQTPYWYTKYTKMFAVNVNAYVLCACVVVVVYEVLCHLLNDRSF